MSRTAELQGPSNATGTFDRQEETPLPPGEAEAAEVGAPSPSISEPRPPGTPEKPWYKRPIWWVIGILVLAAVIVAVVLWWLYARQYESTDDAFIEAHVVRIAPQVAGRVEKVWVKDNEKVTAGQKLVQIDPANYQVQLQQAQADLAEAQGKLAQAKAEQSVKEANVDQAQAQVIVAKANARNAQQELNRYKNLSSAAVSRQQLDSAEAAATSTQAQVQAAEKQAVAAQAQVQAAQTAIQTAQATVQSAQAKIDQAKLMLSYTTIRAPESGWVTQKSVVPGNYLQVGQQLMAIVPGEVWVIANFKETQLTHMQPGQPVDISVDAFPDVDFHGTVDSIQAGSGSVFSLLPPQNATGNYVKVVQRVPVKILLENRPQEPRLVPGMSVEPKVKVR